MTIRSDVRNKEAEQDERSTIPITVRYEGTQAHRAQGRALDAMGVVDAMGALDAMGLTRPPHTFLLFKTQSTGGDCPHLRVAGQDVHVAVHDRGTPGAYSA